MISMKKTPPYRQQEPLDSDKQRPAAIGGKEHCLGGRKHRRERMFDSADIRLLIMHFLAQGPAHGYELIKAIQELSKGEYTPSASIVYPNLTFLEEQGMASPVYDGAGKKQYRLTEEGQSLLDVQRGNLNGIIDRLYSMAILSNNRSIPEMQRAINNIRTALNLRLAKGKISQQTLYNIIDALDNAAKEIERS
ncbi:PadR family transcriptional regulator [Sodalis sp. RH16]|uniref:PadR family transcriptional regulator n=1 Tax=Sodalis sp. RH16 TaxID=3394331 RepID=UPI0039B38090